MDKHVEAPKSLVAEIKTTVHHVTIFAGLMLYGGATALTMGLYQVSWQKTGSEYITQINSVDVEQLAKKAAEEGLASGRYGVKRDGSIYLKEGE